MASTKTTACCWQSTTVDYTELDGGADTEVDAEGKLAAELVEVDDEDELDEGEDDLEELAVDDSELEGKDVNELEADDEDTELVCAGRRRAQNRSRWTTASSRRRQTTSLKPS